MGKVHGRYGEFKVLVGGDVVVDGSLAMLGVLPSSREIVAAVKARLSGGTGT